MHALCLCVYILCVCVFVIYYIRFSWSALITGGVGGGLHLYNMFMSVAFKCKGFYPRCRILVFEYIEQQNPKANTKSIEPIFLTTLWISSPDLKKATHLAELQEGMCRFSQLSYVIQKTLTADRKAKRGHAGYLKIFRFVH